MLSASIVLFLAVTIYGQANFEDYFESVEDSSTSVPTEVEITFSSTNTVPASSTFSSSTTNVPTSSTTNVPTSSTFLPFTSPTSESTTTTNRPTLQTTTTTTTTTSLPKSQACNCDCEFFLEEIARRLKKFEKKMENNYATQTTSSTTTTTASTTTTDKMDRFLEDVFSEFDEKTTTTPTTTTAPTTTTDKMDRYLEDVFSEFDENFDALPKRRSGGRSRTRIEDWEQLLAITISMAAAGITVLLMVCLFLCLQAKHGQDKAPSVEAATAATIEEDESPRIPLAEPEDIPYADEECEEELELRPI